MNRLSIIIPTFDRQSDLRRALFSLSVGNVLPDEVIVVEQGDLGKTQEVINDFAELPIKLHYFDQRSLTGARNLGVTKSSGHLISFIDDDVTVDPSYIKNIVQFFHEHKDVMGVTGRDILAPKRNLFTLLRKVIGVLLWRSSLSRRNRILLSGYNARAAYGDEEVPVEWLSGCSMTYRRDVFDSGLEFDTRLTRWGYGEDASFSFLVNKQFPNSLQYIPTAIYEHHQSPASRLAKQPVIRMEVIYHYIFWRENILNRRPVIARIAYLWFCIGRIALNMVRSRSLFRVPRMFIVSHMFIIQNSRGIRSGECNYNEFILS